MNKATFRTEGPGDGDRIKPLLAELHLPVIKHWQEDDIPGWVLDFFTVNLKSFDIETVRSVMREAIDIRPEYADLHRCYQTLAPGETPLPTML